MIDVIIGVQTVRLSIDYPALQLIEQQTGAGLWALRLQAADQSCKSTHVHLIFMSGLVGGGMDEKEAQELAAILCKPSRFDWVRDQVFLLLDAVIGEIDVAWSEVDLPKKFKAAGQDQPSSRNQAGASIIVKS